jgi:L-ascorbate metabolism protein UlaG (beta-lactamase superfamily)
MEADNFVVHIDPGYTGYPQSQGLPESELTRKANVVLVSHSHKDRLRPEAFQWLRADHTVIVVPPRWRYFCNGSRGGYPGLQTQPFVIKNIKPGESFCIS